MVEVRIGDVDAFGTEDLRLALSQGGGDGKGHGNAMVEVTVDGGAVERFAAVDDHAVHGLFYISAHGT